MRGKLTLLALTLGLLGMGSSMDQFNLVVLDASNNFTEVIEPNVAIGRPGGSGPLIGTNLEFSCGSCIVATFEDATTQIGAGSRICDGMRPVDLVTSGSLICARSTLTGNRSNVDLETWGSGSQGCIDADGGESCLAAGGNTSYLRGPMLCDPLSGLIQKVENLGLHQGSANSLIQKLRNAGRSLCDSNPKNDQSSANRLQAFINEVEAQRGKNIPVLEADELLADAEAILAVLTVP